MAYLIEHDFANFYENAAKKTDDLKVKDSLISLANWEKEHRDMLRELYDESMKQFWDDQGFVPLF
jgi:rubrerythrin